MRSIVLAVASLVIALPAIGAETYKVPVTIIPGSAVFQAGGNTPFAGEIIPVSFPVSRSVLGTPGDCIVGQVTVESELVDGGIEIDVNGTAVGPACSLGGDIEFDIEIAPPELSGTTTVVRLVPKPVSVSLPDADSFMVSFQPGLGGAARATTSSLPELTVANPASGSLSWVRSDATGGELPTQPTGSVAPAFLIPGDTLRARVRMTIRMNGTTAHPAIGGFRTRWEYQVTVPEPSAALSLPLGIAWLAGLSMMRGGA
jgi:hypothetical protein